MWDFQIICLCLRFYMSLLGTNKELSFVSIFALTKRGWKMHYKYMTKFIRSFWIRKMRLRIPYRKTGQFRILLREFKSIAIWIREHLFLGCKMGFKIMCAKWQRNPFMFSGQEIRSRFIQILFCSKKGKSQVKLSLIKLLKHPLCIYKWLVHWIL